MALYNQLASTPSYGDIPAKNYGGSTLSAKTAVIVDTSNVTSVTSAAANDGVGVAVAGAAGVPVVGVLLEDIATLSTGRLRTSGIAVMKCEGTITAGTLLQVSVTASKVGWAKALTAAKAQIGMALSSSTDGEDILVLLQPANNA